MLPGWSLTPLPADAIPVYLPAPYEARFQRLRMTSTEWYTHHFGGTYVTFDNVPSRSAFVLNQPQVYGVNLLDSFNAFLCDLGPIEIYEPDELLGGPQLFKWTAPAWADPINYPRHYRLSIDFKDGAGMQVVMDWADEVNEYLVNVPLTVTGRRLVRPRQALVGAGGVLYRADRTYKDGAVDVQPLVRPEEIAPAGAGGEAEFRVLYLTVKNTCGGILRVTPILDGRRLPYMDVTVPVHELPLTQTFEITLHEEVRPQTHGVRGTFFTAEVALVGPLTTPNEIDALIECYVDCGAQVSDTHHLERDTPDIFELLGMEVERDIVRERFPHQRFSAELYAEHSLTAQTRHPLVGAGGKLYREAAGDDDPITLALIGTDDIMPEGQGGECAFWNLSLAVSHSNTVDVPLELVRYVDGVQAGDPIPVTLPGVATPIYQILEIPLWLSTGYATYAPRGAAVSFQLRSTAPLPATGRIVVEGAELEITRERESMEGHNAS